ncbi:methyltransferase domain-containing protein [Inquilinus limosus]|uniref:class I SAM-dependent methyltransferase n=1 Tax=Inquilinus limosus TaxID=171674 RepID=UPI003F16F1F6
MAFGLASDFSPVAARYDATRNLPDDILSRAFGRLIGDGLFPAAGMVLDAGCGTGQISIPLAGRGFAVHGIDISPEMVRLARRKLRPGQEGYYQVADARGLPYRDAAFDAVVVSKLFMHIQDWPQACRELVRVVRPGGPIVQIGESGMFGNEVRREFSRRADALGHSSRFIGADPRSAEAVPGVMASLGCRTVRIDMPELRWSFPVSRAEALRGFRERLFAEFWYLPAEVYDRILDDTARWAAAQPGGLDAVEPLQPHLWAEVYRTPVRLPSGH